VPCKALQSADLPTPSTPLNPTKPAPPPREQGCLAPIKVLIPPQCLLNPSPEAAVVGGNVLTSQRVTDVVLRAFGAAAASQVRVVVMLSSSICCCLCDHLPHLPSPNPHSSQPPPRPSHDPTAGLHEQPDVGRRGNGVLRDHRRRGGRGARLARPQRGAHAHD